MAKKSWKQGATVSVNRPTGFGMGAEYTITLRLTHGQQATLLSLLGEASSSGNAIATDIQAFIENAFFNQK